MQACLADEVNENACYIVINCYTARGEFSCLHKLNFK